MNKCTLINGSFRDSTFFSHRSKSVSKEEVAPSFFSEAEGCTMDRIQKFCPKITRLQSGNALCVMGTVAHYRKLEEIYNLGTIQTA